MDGSDNFATNSQICLFDKLIIDSRKAFIQSKLQNNNSFVLLIWYPKYTAKIQPEENRITSVRGHILAQRIPLAYDGSPRDQRSISSK